MRGRSYQETPGKMKDPCHLARRGMSPGRASHYDERSRARRNAFHLPRYRVSGCGSLGTALFSSLFFFQACQLPARVAHTHGKPKALGHSPNTHPLRDRCGCPDASGRGSGHPADTLCSGRLTGACTWVARGCPGGHWAQGNSEASSHRLARQGKPLLRLTPWPVSVGTG